MNSNYMLTYIKSVYVLPQKIKALIVNRQKAAGIVSLQLTVFLILSICTEGQGNKFPFCANSPPKHHQYLPHSLLSLVSPSI